MTLHHPLRARRAVDGTWIVDGTPTDCVLLGVGELLAEKPDVCLSGINHGPNMGEDVLYSGTVAAAMEATVIGIPSLAFSYAGALHEEIEGWQDVVRAILDSILGREDLPRSTLFNINLPPISPNDVRGIRVTTLGQRRFAEGITRAKDPSGREYFWIGGGVASWSGDEGCDFQTVEQGYVSVTPLHLDLTNYDLLEEIKDWKLQL